MTDPSKQGASSQRAFKFLQDIAADLSSGDVVFPTFLDATLKVRTAMKNPNLRAEDLAKVVAAEPVVSLRVLRVSNSAALNPGGRVISDIKTAVIRLGFSQVRTLAIAVAMEQLLKSKDMAPFVDLAKGLWEHSIQVAALAYILTRKLAPKLNADEAMLAGLVHDIGQFYLLSRATKYPELFDDKSELGSLMMDWHASIGHALLTTLDTPEEIVKAVDDHEIYGGVMPPRTLSDVVFVANVIASAPNPFAADNHVAPGIHDAVMQDIEKAQIGTLVEDSEAEIQSLLLALQG
jgi:putative nucleotidyltransferase with HDIG domain